jgi:hypothetical protein
MAFHLERQKTTSTPYVLIDESRSYLRLEGRSFYENVVEFFAEVNNWLDKHLATDFKLFTFECELNYFNSSTAKLLLNILLKLDKYSTDENKVVVNWVTTASNDIVIECGEDFKDEVTNLEFNLIIK